MPVFATAGGGGEAADMCFFCPAIVTLLATVAVGLVGAARGSVWAAAGAVMLAGFVGVVVLYAAATLEPSDDPDEQGTQPLMRVTVGWWAASAVVAVGSAGWVAAPRLRGRRPPGGATGTEPATVFFVKPRRPVSHPTPGRPG